MKVTQAEFSGAGQRRLIVPVDAIPYLLSVVDAIFIAISSVVGGAAYSLFLGIPITPISNCAVGLLASFVFIISLRRTGHYEFPDCTRPKVEVASILGSWLSTGLLLTFFAYILKETAYSRGAFLAFTALAPVVLLGVRKIDKIVLQRAVARGAIGRRNIALLGEVGELATLKQADLFSAFGTIEITNFKLSSLLDPVERAVEDIRVLEALSLFVVERDCREILLALPWDDLERLDVIRESIKKLPVSLRLLPDFRVRTLVKSTATQSGAVIIEVQRAPLSLFEQTVKRLLDVVLASVGLILFSPMMVLAALAVKLDSSGPIFFQQRRKGFNGQTFSMIKFRTMRVMEDGDTIVQASKQDPRVTRVGRMLRATSIDELPQMLNVLRGEMSMVGPRPHALAHDNHFSALIGDYAFRHHVKPGITGWAQCNGARGATPGVEHMAERIRLDLWYIDNWSFWLDLKIIFKTVFEVLRKRNSY